MVSPESPLSLVPFDKRSSLSVAGGHISVPEPTARLLFVCHDPAPCHRSGIGVTFTLDFHDGQIHVENLSADEPSTIYAAMPIARPADPAIVPRPPYYPSYAGLSPEQKWIYLNWLTDITRPVNIGYVFIYYYGLERHLLIGEFDLAFDEILLLRQTHAGNGSFDSYSRSALLNSALFRKDRSRLEQLYRIAPPRCLENTDLILGHYLGHDLGPEGLLRLAPSVRGVEKRYIQKNPEEYRLALASVLTEQFGEPLLPFAFAYSISDVPKKEHLLFGNVSFPSNIRTPAMPSFIDHEPFIAEVTRVLRLAHEKTKLALASARRNSKSRPA